MFEENDRTAKYEHFTHITMIHDIRLTRCLGWHILRKRLGYAENLNIISGRSIHEYDTNILQSLSVDLHNFQYMNDMKMVGTIPNPLFQCDDRMIEAELLTKGQFQASK